MKEDANGKTVIESTRRLSRSVGMAILELPDPKEFYVARTPPVKSPHWEWLKAVVERVRASKGSSVRAHHWGWDPDWDTVSFWLQPAAPLSMWTPSQPYTISAAYGSNLAGAKTGLSRLDGAFELVRTVPAPVAFSQLTVAGFADKRRRSQPQVEANLWRLRGRSMWSVDARFKESHPDLKAGRSPAEVTALTRERLGPVDRVDSNGRDSDPLSPTRSGLGDPEEAYRLFQSVIEVAVPRPTNWRVVFEFDAYQWAKWTETLDAFELGWSYNGNLHPPHGFQPYKRPSLIHPAHTHRIPLESWKPGLPPRLQMSMVHASEGTWLEFETAKGRETLDDISSLVRTLEVWEGPPELRWTG
jgi:hypothetical protein